MTDDQDLRAAMERAADDVEPTDRLADIRRRTRRTSRRRRSWFVAGGTGLAVASVVTVALVAGSSSPQRAADPAAPAATSAAATPTPAPSTTPLAPSAPDSVNAQPVYYVGAGPDGPDAPDDVLYQTLGFGDGVLDALMKEPYDPDYRTLWPQGSLLAATDAGDVVVVDLGDASLAERPAGMSTEEAQLALQQVAYTVAAALDTDAGLLFELPGGAAAESVLGIPTGGGVVERAPELDVLSHMNILDPSEESIYPRTGELVVTGLGNSFEASGQCSLEREDGTEVDAYLAQMDGWIKPRLYPWELTIDLADVAPGTYTVVCITDDPTGGEGRGTDTDTRTVIVE